MQAAQYDWVFVHCMFVVMALRERRESPETAILYIVAGK